MGPEKVFGELAILYNCTRTASVKGKRTSYINTCTVPNLSGKEIVNNNKYIDLEGC